MPSRGVCWFIVAFWLATTGWLFWHDLRPRWLPGEPPALLPDDVDEVDPRGGGGHKISWLVQRKQGDTTQTVFRALTWVEYHREDLSFSLRAELSSHAVAKGGSVLIGKIFQIEKTVSEYRVNRDGELLSMKAEVTAAPQVTQLLPELKSFLAPILPRSSATQSNEPPSVSLHLWGEVRDRQFFAHCRAEGKNGAKLLQFDLPPAPVSHTGSVLMPLHPVNHIRRLYGGRSWRQPLIDPMRDAFAFVPGFSGGVRWLHAQVLPRPQSLKMGDKEASCWVIEYTNDENETIGRTWVELDSERVLQQEAILDDGHWIMKRELERHSGKQPFQAP